MAFYIFFIIITTNHTPREHATARKAPHTLAYCLCYYFIISYKILYKPYAKMEKVPHPGRGVIIIRIMTRIVTSKNEKEL